MSQPVIAASNPVPDNFFEADNVYSVAGTGQYLLIVEAISSSGHRYFTAYTSPTIAGAWTPLAASQANPFIAAHYAQMFRRLGGYTVGVGHFFTLDRARFEGQFDCVLGGEPSEEIVSILANRPSGYVEPQPVPLNVVPNLKHLYPAGQQTFTGN